MSDVTDFMIKRNFFSKSVLFGYVGFAVLLVGIVSWLPNSGAASSGCQTPTFAVVVKPNVANSLRAVAAGDLNGDSKPDLVTVNYFDDSATVLIGDGLGNFSVSGTLASGIRPSALALADFTSDGKLDLVITRDFSTSVSLFVGNGQAGFASPTSFTVGTNPLSIVTADFNTDGKLDLATGNDGNNTITVLFGNGSGSFPSTVTINGVRPPSLVAADFNGDTKPDIAAVNTNVGMVSVSLSDGNGGFGAVNNFSGGFDLHAITAADLNGDSKMDLAVTNFNDCCHPAFVAVLLGNGDGTFGAFTKFSAPFGPISITAGDFNGDGKKDIATANIQQTSSNVAVLLGDGLGALGAPTTFLVGGAPNWVTTGDINVDGVTDLITTAPPNLGVLLNGCGGAPTPTPTPTPTPIPTPTPTPTPAQGDIVISQIYSGAGQPNSTFQNNYVELFNRTNTAIDINGWPLAFTSATGQFTFTVGFVSSRGLAIGPGRYFLIQLGPTHATGAPLPAPDASSSSNMDLSLSGKIGFSRLGSGIPTNCPLPNPNVLDFVGYGIDANCFEGAGPTPNLSSTTAAIRNSGGCADTDSNSNDFSVGVPNPRNSLSLGTSCGTTLSLSASSVGINEGVNTLNLNVTRTGDTSITATVEYATSDTAAANSCSVINGQASSRCDYQPTFGKLTFAAGETSKTISIPIVDDTYSEGAETFTLTLSNATGVSLGSPSVATLTINDGPTDGGTNPIDQPAFFVRQHYLDFLNREPDQTGLQFWTNEITSCGADAQCVQVKRINVSAAFFLSIEFQETGYLAYRMYKAGFGNLTSPPATPVPTTYFDFLKDTQQIAKGIQVGVPGWEAALEANKQAYALAFVQRPAFQAAYPNSMTATQFVTKLDTNAGGVLSPTEKANVVSIVDVNLSDPSRRATALRAVAEDVDLKAAESNRAFVLMQYFGYLRRNPNDAPDADFGGYNFWLGKLNQFNGNFVDAEMVKAFIVAGEYKQRFGP